VTERRRAEARIVHLATHDPLTGLPNRMLFQERIAEAIGQLSGRKACAVVYIDLDRFKAVNDTHGHLAGDEVLISTARRLRACVREGDTVTRLGGDEFAILLGSVGRREQIESLAARIVRKIARPYQIGKERLTIGISLGIAAAPGDGDCAEDLIKHADTALYRAKLAGGDTWRFYDEPANPRGAEVAVQSPNRVTEP
jgi:diguanylate cyclase (GGDEF)-like protein